MEFAVNAAKENRSGADLMAKGITLSDPQAGELVFLNLPKRPGCGTDKTAPSAPGRVLSRCEVNLGYSGVGVYWSPGSDDNWLSGYEIRRGDVVIDKVRTGTYYFDRSEGWDSNAEYAVRTIDGDGNVSGWTAASATVQDVPVYSTLGGHSGKSGLQRLESGVFERWLELCRDDLGSEGFALSRVGRYCQAAGWS